MKSVRQVQCTSYSCGSPRQCATRELFWWTNTPREDGVGGMKGKLERSRTQNTAVNSIAWVTGAIRSLAGRKLLLLPVTCVWRQLAALSLTLGGHRPLVARRCTVGRRHLPHFNSCVTTRVILVVDYSKSDGRITSAWFFFLLFDRDHNKSHGKFRTNSRVKNIIIRNKKKKQKNVISLHEIWIII